MSKKIIYTCNGCKNNADEVRTGHWKQLVWKFRRTYDNIVVEDYLGDFCPTCRTKITEFLKSLDTRMS